MAEQNNIERRLTTTKNKYIKYEETIFSSTLIEIKKNSHTKNKNCRHKSTSPKKKNAAQ